MNGERRWLRRLRATSVLVATSPLLDGIGGRYFEDCNEALPHQPGTRVGVAAHAIDAEAAERLWDVSLETLWSGSVLDHETARVG